MPSKDSLNPKLPGLGSFIAGMPVPRPDAKPPEKYSLTKEMTIDDVEQAVARLAYANVVYEYIIQSVIRVIEPKNVGVKTTKTLARLMKEAIDPALNSLMRDIDNDHFPLTKIIIVEEHTMPADKFEVLGDAATAPAVTNTDEGMAPPPPPVPAPLPPAKDMPKNEDGE